MIKTFAECKNPDSSSMLNLHRVLFCTDMKFDKIMHINCFCFLSIAFHWLVTTFGIAIPCEYRGTPKSDQLTSIGNLKS